MSEDKTKVRIKMTKELLDAGRYNADIAVSFDTGERAVAVDYRANSDTGRFRLVRSIVEEEDSEVVLSEGALSGHVGRLLDHSAVAGADDGTEYEYRLEVTP